MKKRVIARVLCCLFAVILCMSLLPGALAANFVPAPKTAYATEFVTKCDGQQWFLNEIERLLNLEQKTLNTITSAEDLANIKSLGFKDAGINGQLPTAIGELKELRYLFLSGNHLSGTIPAALFSLSKLQEVDLAGNSYTGAIPVAFGTMPALTSLNLKNNGFVGTIPAEILNNARLTLLNLEGNQLNGAIPASINKMTGLTYLNLSKNNWSGTIPDVSGLSALVALSLWNCNLTGEIPASVYTLTHLQILDLAYNGLSGEISQDVGDLASLQFLSLSTNKLTGEIPNSIQKLTKLQTLNLSINRLRGTIPDVFGATSLKEIRLDNNYLRGLIPATLKARYDTGAMVYLDNNYLTGAVLKDMKNNTKNFADGAATEQYQLTASQSTVQTNKTAGVNVYSLLRNQSKTTSNATQKVLLNPDEYTIAYDDTKMEVTVTASGIFVKALMDIPLADNLTIEIRIKDNTGSDYSKVMIKVTTDSVPSGGGGGGGGETITDPKTPLGGPEHNPYITGYPDKTFRPAGQITREEVAAMVIRALEIEPANFSVSSYSDVQKSRWSFGYIEEATERGYLKGYPNNIFRPATAMTRAELAAMLVRIAEKQGRTGTGEERTFSDLDVDAWYYAEVLSAARLGLINGYPDGTFRPGNTITRAEAVAMINRFLDRDPACESVVKMDCPFSDVKADHWAYQHILEASVKHTIK